MEPAPPQEELPPLSAYEDDVVQQPRKGNGSDGSPVIPVEPVSPDSTVDPLDWPKLAPLQPPDRKWAIKGWLGFGHVTLLVGSGGIGKTLLAQQMMSCLALGRPFIEAVERPYRCLMWACEDDHDELWRRQVALSRWCQAGLEEFHEWLTIVPRHGLDNALVSTEFGKLMFSPLIERLKEQADDLDSEVVVLDNVAQLYGGNENDRHSVTAFMNALSGALRGRAILLLAHPSRSAGSEFSGSSAWENTARTRLYLGATLPGEKPDPEANPDDTVRYLSRRKANYSPKDWRRLTYADGALTPDASEAADDGGIIASIKSKRAERVILTGLQKLATVGVHGTDGKRSPSFLPKVLIEYSLSEGLPSHELASAMRSLMMEGKLSRQQVGKTQNRTAIMGLVPSTPPQAS